MPKKRGIYYLGRIIKRGRLDQELMMQSILNPSSVTRGKHDWTFIETMKGKIGGDDYVYGKLSKYSPDARLKFVEPEVRREVEREEPNLSISASPFVYIPSSSGIACLHNSRDIPHWLFRTRFSEVIEATNDNFFVDCTVEPITDMRSFSIKLSQMQTITKISALVHPSNPLFGPLWQSLRAYIGNRNLTNLEVKEEAEYDEQINTSLPNIVKDIVDGNDPMKAGSDREVPIADAAVLMAADGYGNGTLEGESHGKKIVIRTSETVRNFTFDREPEPDELATIAEEFLRDVERERNLGH